MLWIFKKKKGKEKKKMCLATVWYIHRSSDKPFLFSKCEVFLYFYDNIFRLSLCL